MNRQSSDSTLVPNDSQQSQDARNGDNASESSRPNIRKRNTNEVERGQGGQEKSKDSKEKEKDKDKDQEKKGGPPSPEEDPNIVTWYGDKDPANPQKYVLTSLKYYCLEYLPEIFPSSAGVCSKNALSLANFAC